MLNINRIEFDNLTTTERNALVLPAKGTLIYNVTSNEFEANTGTAAAPIWSGLGGGGASHFLGSFANETTPPFPAGPYSAGDVYYNTSINQMMYYDSSRSRFLSIATITLNCGRGSVTSPGAFFRTAGNVTFIANSRGWYAPFGGVLIALTGTRTNTINAQVELLDGLTVAATLDFSTNTTAATVYNADVTSGNILTVRTSALTGRVVDGNIIATFKLKSP